MCNVPKSRKRKGNVATFSFHAYLHLRCKSDEKLHTFLWRNTPPQQNTFLISFLSSQGETSIYSLPNHLVSNAEVKVISNSIFQNSVFWKTGISDTYKWIISNIQRLKNAKSDSATKMWSNYLYQYVAMYLVHSIVLKVALNNMLNTTVKRPNIPMTCLLQKSIYKLKGKLTWTNEHQTKKKFSEAHKYILKLLKYAQSMLSILHAILLEVETYFSILPNN